MAAIIPNHMSAAKGNDGLRSGMEEGLVAGRSPSPYLHPWSAGSSGSDSRNRMTSA